jgi:hypothetical protein
MSLLSALPAGLAWLGRQGTRAVAVSLFLGIAVPPLAALFKPFVTEAIVGLLMLAFLRVEPRALRNQFARPGLLIAASAWIMLAVPAVLGALAAALGFADLAPGVFVGLVLQAVGPPIMSAPAFAALMGLDAALSLATLVLCMAIMPLIAPAFAHVLAGSSLALSGPALGLRLLLIVAGSALAAALVRRLAGTPWVERQHERIDGLNVILLFVFAVAVMDGIAARLLADPLFVIELVVLAFAVALGLTALTALVFARAGRRRALAIGLCAGIRNIGLMLAATGGAVPDQTWLYFGLSQFPTYLLPHLLKPLADRPDPPAR